MKHRVVMGVLAAAATQFFWVSPMWAAQRSAIGMEMLVVMPKGHRLAIYQEEVLTGGQATARVGILPHAKNLIGLGARVLSRHGDITRVQGSSKKWALRYEVGWNGRSASLPVSTVEGVNTLVILTPDSLAVPTVLNPALNPSGKGRLPGVPNSPVFEEFSTSQVGPGESVPLVVEAASKGVPVAAGSAGDYPRVGLVWVALCLVAATLTIVWAFHWKPLDGRLRRQGMRSALLRELAVWDASFGRGEIAMEDYQSHRQEMIEALVGVWAVDGR